MTRKIKVNFNRREPPIKCMNTKNCFDIHSVGVVFIQQISLCGLWQIPGLTAGSNKVNSGNYLICFRIIILTPKLNRKRSPLTIEIIRIMSVIYISITLCECHINKIICNLYYIKILL